MATFLKGALFGIFLASQIFAKEAVFVLPYDNKQALKELKSSIKNAKNSVDIAIYSFTHKDIAKSIREAAKQGVKVRIIYDKSQLDSKFSTIGNLSAIRNINTCVLRGIGSGNISGIMHQKLLIIDGSKIAFGSANWSKNAFTNNYEILYFTDNAKLASKINSSFREMWRACKPY
ncbi:MAG: phospholipase D-like domain-containing protein [Helicobacter sp.]|nr:phospholipase D-like domain-containing protein [Helicobacter sp.]